jgi:hypothetical protein
MLLFSTYLLRSGDVQGGHTRRDAMVDSVSSHLHSMLFFSHLAQIGIPAINPSFNDLPPRYFPKPRPTPKKRTSNARIILGVSFIGITDAIRLLHDYYI